MKYFYTIERKDGTTASGTMTAGNIGQAHNAMTATAAGDKCRIYPINRALLALGVAAATAKNAVMRQGTETQVTIDRELRMLSAMTAAAMAVADMTGRDVTTYILDRLCRMSADSQDFFSVAMTGIEYAIENGGGVVAATAAGYKYLNRYVYSLKTATEKELSTEYLIDGGGDIVAINTAISCIVRGGDRWQAVAGGTLDATAAAALGNAIRAACALLSPSQRRIVELTGRGYSQKQIADMTGRDIRTIERNTAIIRGKIAAYMTDNAPQFAAMIDGKAAQAAAATAAKMPRTADGAARDKATQAARAAAYRARKRAAAQAAKG